MALQDALPYRTLICFQTHAAARWNRVDPGVPPAMCSHFQQGAHLQLYPRRGGGEWGKESVADTSRKGGGESRSQGLAGGSIFPTLKSQTGGKDGDPREEPVRTVAGITESSEREQCEQPQIHP